MKLLLYLTALAIASATVLGVDVNSADLKCRLRSKSRLYLDCEFCGEPTKNSKFITIDGSNRLVANNGTQMFHFFQCEPPTRAWGGDFDTVGIVKLADNPDLCLTIAAAKARATIRGLAISDGVLTMSECKARNENGFSRQWFSAAGAHLQFLGRGDDDSRSDAVTHKGAIAFTEDWSFTQHFHFREYPSLHFNDTSLRRKLDRE